VPRQDLDLELKLRMRRIFWKMGFFCPLEVMVSAWEYETDKRHDVTDIDVLGIRFSSDLRVTNIIADCKSGREAAGRLLWLRGAIDLLDASAGYFVKNRLHPNTRAIASKLNIATLDLDNLVLLEKQVDVSNVPSLIGNPDVYKLQQSLWGLHLQKASKLNNSEARMKRVYQYYDYNFWFIEPHRNIITSVENISSIRDRIVSGDQRSELLFYRIAALFAVSLLQAGHDVISKNVSEVSSFARQYVFGGTLALREREKFFELLKRYTGEDVRLEPPYFPALLELINTIVRHSGQSADCPRYIEAVGLQKISGTPLDVKSFFGMTYDEGTLKVAKDIVLFLVDSCNLDKGLIVDFLAQ